MGAQSTLPEVEPAAAGYVVEGLWEENVLQRPRRASKPEQIGEEVRSSISLLVRDARQHTCLLSCFSVTVLSLRAMNKQFG